MRGPGREMMIYRYIRQPNGRAHLSRNQSLGPRIAYQCSSTSWFQEITHQPDCGVIDLAFPYFNGQGLVYLIPWTREGKGDQICRERKGAGV